MTCIIIIRGMTTRVNPREKPGEIPRGEVTEDSAEHDLISVRATEWEGHLASCALY